MTKQTLGAKCVFVLKYGNFSVCICENKENFELGYWVGGCGVAVC